MLGSLLFLSNLATVVFSFGPLPGPVPCDETKCKLPDCRCFSSNIPGSIPPDQTPQFVVLSMQGTSDEYNTKMYQDVVQDLKNPNGCPVSGTWFVYDHITDYRTVNNIYNNNNVEIGVMPMLEESDIFWEDEAIYGDWMSGIESAKSAVAFLGNVPRSEIRGLRGHHQILGGNHQFQAYMDYTPPADGLMYDSTWQSSVLDEPVWPFTLDYFADMNSTRGTRPTNQFPGVWELALSQYLAQNGSSCNSLLECEQIKGDESFADFLVRNFLRHYEGNRAPFVVQLDYDFLNPIYPQHATEIRESLYRLLSFPDVYVVSMKDALEWVRHPTKLSDLADFPYWECGNNAAPTACQDPNCCQFDTGTNCLTGECALDVMSPPTFDIPHRFCVACTKMLPIWGNPYGMRNNVGRCEV